MHDQSSDKLERLVIHGLSTDGYAIVTESSYESIVKDERVWELDDAPTWGEVKELGLSYEVVVGLSHEDLEEVIELIEPDLDLAGEGSIESRWDAVRSLTWVDLESGYSDDDEFPAGSGIAMGLDTLLQSAMLDDLPDAVIERFDIGYESRLNGYLGRIDELAPVVEALKELGYRFAE